MNKDTITRLARQAEGEEQHHGMWRMHVEDLERFAALVAAAEREECAKLCEAEADKSVADQEAGGMYCCAAAIRSRK